MILSTCENIPNKKITESLGIARGSTVRARNALRDLMAGLKSVVGGEILETLRLGDKFPFLNEREHPSIADLLVIEDIVNLVVLKGSPFREELSSLDQLLAERPRVRKWRDAVMRINKPIWDEIHGVLEMVAENASKKIDSESSRRRFDDVASMSRL